MIATLAAVEFVLIYFFVIEPPLPPKPPPSAGGPPPIPEKNQLCLALLIGFFWPFHIAMWEVHTVARLEQKYDWKPWQIGMYEFALLATVVPVCFVPFAKWMSDQTGMKSEH